MGSHSKKSKKSNNNIYKINYKQRIYFKFVSADKKFGLIKYGDPVYVYLYYIVDYNSSPPKKHYIKKYNDNPNGHGPGTPLSFNQKRSKYKLYLYPYNIHEKLDSVYINSKFILSMNKFDCESSCNNIWTNNCGYYGCRVTNNYNGLIQFNHGQGSKDTSIGGHVEYLQFHNN